MSDNLQYPQLVWLEQVEVKGEPQKTYSLGNYKITTLGFS